MKDLMRKLLWKYYYRYKPLSDVDIEGRYSPSQKALMFYYQHSDAYHKTPSDHIILTRQDIRIPEKIEPHLRELGVLDLSSFYFIGARSTIGMKDKALQHVCDVFIKNGYKVQWLWEDSSALLFVNK